MRIVSTFAGGGGSSTGYKMAGASVVAAVEWEAHAVECYRLNHPDTAVIHGDVAEVTGAQILDAAGLSAGDVDVLDGSPPCQGFSTSGHRVLDDPRNQLFKHQLRLIDELQPRAVVIENVSGMLKGKMKPVAAEIFQSIKDLGYDVTAGLIKATGFGVAQRRPRVFFIGVKGGGFKLPAPTHTKAVRPRDALSGIVPGAYPTPGTDTMADLLGRTLLPGENGTACFKRIGTKKTGYYSAVKLHPTKPAPTITKMMPGGGYWHWTHRHLSVEEALALTGYPEGYILPGSVAKRWARVGNSVAPPVAAAIGTALRKALNL
jgi:DNA (cytosine-5)-methyltransferase 1